MSDHALEDGTWKMVPNVFSADARALSTLDGTPGSVQTASQTAPTVFSMSTYATLAQLTLAPGLHPSMSSNPHSLD